MYIYIYTYMYICVCVYVCVCVISTCNHVRKKKKGLPAGLNFGGGQP